jgi:TRAP-type C4-dicarboxylate transport system substrate-binding protein
MRRIYMINLPDMKAFEKLTPEEKQYALEILKEYAESGHSELLEELKYSDYEEIPVDIMTFITEEQYLGRGL